MPSFSAAVPLRLLQALCFVWAGLVAGISFLEAPVKFTAPSLTRSVGLDVGRHVFAALNKAEIGMAVLAIGLLIAARPEGWVRWILAAVWVSLLIQTLWLLPELREQARTIIAGGAGPDTNLVHLGYGVLEVVKVAALLAAGWLSTPPG